MVRVLWAERKSPILSSSSLACLAHIPGINLTSGCANDCIYCYGRGYSNFPGENTVTIYTSILEKLKNELSQKRNKPYAVYFSPSSDIFQAVPEVLEITHAVLELLFSRDIGVAFVTKGKIPDRTLNLLLANADKVRAQVGIITHDDGIRKQFEPQAASIDIRLNQIAKMTTGGIAVEARLIPILPGITDKPESIDFLCAAISSAGVKRGAISTLFLRPAITASLKKRILDKHTLVNLLVLYNDRSRLRVSTEGSSIVPLPHPKRAEIYLRYQQIAQNYGIELSVCGCMNPDINGKCNIIGKWEDGLQKSLFYMEG